MEKHFIIQDMVFLFVHVDGKKNIFKESVMLFCSRMLRPLSLTKEKSSSTLIASSIL